MSPTNAFLFIAIMRFAIGTIIAAAVVATNAMVLTERQVVSNTVCTRLSVPVFGTRNVFTCAAPTTCHVTATSTFGFAGLTFTVTSGVSISFRN